MLNSSKLFELALIPFGFGFTSQGVKPIHSYSMLSLRLSSILIMGKIFLLMVTLGRLCSKLLNISRIKLQTTTICDVNYVLLDKVLDILELP